MLDLQSAFWPDFMDRLFAYLGEYAANVLGSYVIGLLLLSAIVALTYWRSSRTRRALAEAEARIGRQP